MQALDPYGKGGCIHREAACARLIPLQAPSLPPALSGRQFTGGRDVHNLLEYLPESAHRSKDND